MSADLGTLNALLERAQAATGPDPLLDAHLVCHLLAPAGSIVTVAPITGEIRVCTGKTKRPAIPGRDIVWPGWHRQPLTGSLDAALAAVAEVLPGSRYEITTTGFSPGASIMPEGWLPGRCFSGGYAPTAPLAVWRAALRALIDEAEHVERTLERQAGGAGEG